MNMRQHKRNVVAKQQQSLRKNRNIYKEMYEMMDCMISEYKNIKRDILVFDSLAQAMNQIDKTSE